jgi:DNA-binding transcriptional LysR family regulator
MLEVRRLRVLWEVARQGSFSAAAHALGYSQSAVSQQIATLEREAGLRLVERSGRSIRLTGAGEALVRRTGTILGELAAAEAELRAIAGLRAGQVRVSTIASAATSLLPAALTAFRARHPGVEVALSLVELPGDAVARLDTGQLDLSLLVQPSDRPATVPDRIRFHPLFDDPMLVVLPRGHPLAGRPAVRLTDLAGEPWLLGGGPGCPDGEMTLRACLAAGFEPRVEVPFPTDDYHATQGLVAAGVGVTLLPRLALAVPRGDLAVRPLLGAPLTRSVIAAVRSDTGDPAAQAMVDALLEAGARHRDGGEPG